MKITVSLPGYNSHSMPAAFFTLEHFRVCSHFLATTTCKIPPILILPNFFDSSQNHTGNSLYIKNSCYLIILYSNALKY